MIGTNDMEKENKKLDELLAERMEWSCWKIYRSYFWKDHKAYFSAMLKYFKDFSCNLLLFLVVLLYFPIWEIIVRPYLTMIYKKEIIKYNEKRERLHNSMSRLTQKVEKDGTV